MPSSFDSILDTLESISAELNVLTARLNAIEQGSGVSVVAVITAHRYANPAEAVDFGRRGAQRSWTVALTDVERAPADVHGPARLAQPERNASTDASARAGDDCHLAAAFDRHGRVASTERWHILDRQQPPAAS